MISITVIKKDGTKREFTKEFRAGGSWELSIRYEGEFAIIKDVHGNETIFPSVDVDEIKTMQAPHF